MKKKTALHIITFTYFFIFLSGISTGQMQIPIKDSLYSAILKESRPINVILPKNFDSKSQDKYELLFCLDGISDFLRTELDILQGEGFVPKNMIVIGIQNTENNGISMRDRDFTPTATSPISGGADKFLSFIKNELVPYVINKYDGKANGNTLYGGSLGGLFVMYIFLNEPELFTSYIAIDPSLWWDNFYLNKIALKKFNSLTSLNNTLFIAGRKGNAYRDMGIAEMDSILQTKAPSGLNWGCTGYDNETHYSTNFKGFWDGLKFSYGGFYASTGGYMTSRKIAIKPKKGIVHKGTPFNLICYNLAADKYLYYTTDGTIPTSSSQKLAGEETPITLSANSKIIVKSLGVRKEYDRLDSAYFEISTVFSSIPKPREINPGGLNYMYYECEWEKLSDIKKLKPTRTGLADKNFDINKFSKQNSFVCNMEGYIEISKSGHYIFEMGGGNDFSKVYIGDRLVLGKNFVSGDGENFLVPLEKGYYPIRIEYYYKKGGKDLQPIYLKPELINDFPIPVEMLYHH
jgi:predicted alpha/beta superfamily hydrolase